MAGTFGGYGLPLNGALPAALAGGAAYSLDDGANTAPPASSSAAVAAALARAAPDAADVAPPSEEVLVENGLVKARARVEACRNRHARCWRAGRRLIFALPSSSRCARGTQAIGGRTWCGVEYGTAPGYARSYFEARAPSRRRTRSCAGCFALRTRNSSFLRRVRASPPAVLRGRAVCGRHPARRLGGV
jgi:hypothetical protein